MNLGQYINLLKSPSAGSLCLIGVALVLYYLSTLIYALRWKLVLRYMGKRVSTKELLKMILSSIFVNNITPASRSGGEILRVVWLSKTHKVPASLSTASIIYERISEVIPIAFLLVLGLSYLTGHMIYIALPLMGGIILIWMRWEWFFSLFVRLFKARLTPEEFNNVVSIKKKPLLNIYTVGFSSAVWLLDIARLKMIVLAFGWNPSLRFLAVISLANLIFGIMAFTPGGIGIIEAGLLGTLTYFGICLSVALPVTLMERFISYITSSVVGFSVLTTSGGVQIWKALRSH